MVVTRLLVLASIASTQRRFAPGASPRRRLAQTPGIECCSRVRNVARWRRERRRLDLGWLVVFNADSRFAVASVILGRVVVGTVLVVDAQSPAQPIVAFALAVIALAAAGCGGTEQVTDTATTPAVTEPAPEPTTEPAASPSADPAALVASADRYGPCLADLGVTDIPTTGPGPSGNLVVTVETPEGQTLTWNVGSATPATCSPLRPTSRPLRRWKASAADPVGPGDDTGAVDPSDAERRLQRSMAWSPGQKILNDTGAREPEHTFHQPVPITARIVWAYDGEEHIDTVALGRTGREVYVRMVVPRYPRFTGVWLAGRCKRGAPLGPNPRYRDPRPGWFAFARHRANGTLSSNTSLLHKSGPRQS